MALSAKGEVVQAACMEARAILNKPLMCFSKQEFIRGLV